MFIIGRFALTGVIGTAIGHAWSGRPAYGFGRGITAAAIVSLGEKFFGSYGYYASWGLILASYLNEINNQIQAEKLAEPRITQARNEIRAGVLEGIERGWLRGYELKDQ